MLWGPPGTGKTLMAESMAGETGKPFVFVDPGAFNNMFFGVGVLKVKGLFRKLRKLALRYGGVVVFFDEADALGNRGIMTNRGPGAYSKFSPECRGISYLSPNSAYSITRSTLISDFSTDVPEKGKSEDRFVMGSGGAGGGAGMGTLQALLTELSGLKKPRDRKSTRLNSSHVSESRMPSSA